MNMPIEICFQQSYYLSKVLVIGFVILISKQVNLTQFLDHKKAFATIVHKILLGRLEAYAITDTRITWFRSYHSEREAVCSVEGTIPKPRK